MLSPMSAAPTAHLTAGVVRGSVHDGVHRFLGIPYAAAPFGPNRFREPQPVAVWDDVRPADSFGPTSPQLPYSGPIGDLLGSVIIDGDDVLTVNVWAPSDAEAAPVVLWLHGGALERGTAAIPLYDGSVFARAGIVFASINYRLGSEGFSVLEGAPTNLGLLDAVAALQWVHREIGSFGGDPASITIMGESAGGALVAGLLAVETSRAMIARAIIQSGPLQAQPRRKSGRVTAQLARLLGIRPERDAFATVAPAMLLEARRTHSAGSSPLGGAPGFQFTIDPETLPRSPHDVLGDLDVPLLIGSNTDEYRLWFAPGQLAEITEAKLLLARLALRIPRRAIRAYRSHFPGASTGEIFGQVATDLLLRGPLTRVARRRETSTFVYEFAWRSPVRDLRAAHALELGFVFDQLDSEDAKRMAGTDAPRQLAAEMRDAWIAFIKTGDPGWAPYGKNRMTRIFDAESSTEPQRRIEGLDLLPG